MYKTTKEFLVQFGLSSLRELPTLKEFEELGRLALTDEMPERPAAPTPADAPAALTEASLGMNDDSEPAPGNGASEESKTAVPGEQQHTTEEQKIEIGSDG